MKTRILILSAMCLSMVSFAQKNELKAADKAVKSGKMAEAKTALESIAGSISGSEDKYQAQYHFLNGQVLADMASNGQDNLYQDAADAMKSVLDVEEKSGKLKYSDDARKLMAKMVSDLVNSAVTDNSNKSFEKAADKLYLSYKMSPTDTLYLYYAASSAVNGKHYDKALSMYNELQEVGYDGGGIAYKATNTETGEVETMDKSRRDLMIKSPLYSDPVDEAIPSKKAEIVKNTALIYTQLGQDDKALEAYKMARESSPDDVNLLLNEANLHYKLGDKDKFLAMMAEASSMAPDNPDLQYNIGVINMEQGNLAEARAAYSRALEINPKYINALLNLSTTYVNEGNGLIDAMNNLGNSRSDIAKYDALKKQKDDLFMEGATILEDALKENPGNQGILAQLKNIYGALGDNDNFMRLKKLLGE